MNLKKMYEQSFDLSAIEFELKTKIPIKRLVNIIGDFYWDMGHRDIQIYNWKLSDPIIHYLPDFYLEDESKVKEIAVRTFEGQNRQVFDSIIFRFASYDRNQVTILGNFGFGFKSWNFIYVAIAFLISLGFAAQPHTTGLMSAFIFILLVVPMYIYGRFRIFKAEKHPSLGRFKKEFEEHIREKEKEMFPNDY